MVSWNYRMSEFGRYLWKSSFPKPLLSQGHLENVAQDHVQANFECLQEGRFHNFPGQFVPVLSHPHRKKHFPMFRWHLICANLCMLPVILCHLWTCWGCTPLFWYDSEEPEKQEYRIFSKQEASIWSKKRFLVLFIQFGAWLLDKQTNKQKQHKRLMSVSVPKQSALHIRIFDSSPWLVVILEWKGLKVKF